MERRAHERIDFGGEVELERDGAKFEAVSKDIAAGGMCLVFGEAAPFMVGDQVTVRFHLPALSAPTEIPAIVRWVGGPDRAAGGLEFTHGLRAREVWAINQLQGGEH